MNRKARQELVGIGALVVGLFLGLTLLRLPLTGSWGGTVGSALWRACGVGALLLPLLGVGWALAAFERLGSLSAGRAAVLGVGLVLLLPYGIGTVAGASFPADYAAWTPTQQLVGRLPALLARGVHQTLGTAGGVLVGLFALSALGILTVGWHPLAMLRAGSREQGAGKPAPPQSKRAGPEPAAPRKEPLPAPSSPLPKTRKMKAAPPARPTPVPAGVLIPPIDLLTPAPLA